MTRLFARITTIFSAVIALLAFVDAAQAQDAYRIRPGDTLRLEVLEDATLNRSVLVSPDGRISVPLAGSVMAAGNPLEAIQRAVSAQLAPNFAAPPTVFISIERLVERVPAGPAGPVAPPPTIDIYVLGEVANPGKLEVSPGTTVLQLFAQMGGFSKFAATKRIQLRRADASGAEQVFLINYNDIEQGTSKTGATVLREGDVIIVPQRRLFE